MVAYTLVQRLTPNLALAGAGLAGVLVALATLAIPAPLLEELVVTSGIAAFVPAAEPPLGVTARICVGVFAGGAAALIAWFLLSALLVWRDSRGKVEEEGIRRPAVRRADAHPDAPPRPPLLATRDLGMPYRAKVEQVDAESEDSLADARIFAGAEGKAETVNADVRDLHLPELLPEPVIAMGSPAPPAESVPAVAIPQPQVEPKVEMPSIVARSAPPLDPQPLPADLDQPLSAFDPEAIPERPLAPPPPLKPLHRAPSPVFAEGERFETFEFTPSSRPALAASVAPVVPPRSDSLAAPETEASVHALLDRLERGIVRRSEQVPAAETETAPAPPPEPSPEPEALGLEGALAALRKLAVRV
ncbi:hypothetical protein OK349_15840 [Sphingomonas sp. BT-65]|uniref:hypothetical protein n=1 Tax=Sphingomonas sp. BT-65 TaxID=2989821 RepID=UPI0022362F27|nr:hypothetical protein [Sphingomonas sp. BT-65]MCW4463184.1 hypothetical protein [Sphingomonas sp. BT-65]